MSSLFTIWILWCLDTAFHIVPALKNDWHKIIFFASYLVISDFSASIFPPCSSSVWDSKVRCICLLLAKALLLSERLVSRCNQQKRQATVAKVTKYAIKELQKSIRALKQLKNCDFCLCFLYGHDLAHRLSGLPVFSHGNSYHKHRPISSTNYC